MRIRIDKIKLRESVKKVASAADKKGHIPILSNILMEAQDSDLKLTSTDLEIGITTSTKCTIEEPGRATVNAFKLLKISSSLSGSEVELNLEGEVLKVRSSNSSFTLSTLPVEEFPEVKFEGQNPISIPSAQFDRALRKVLYAVGKDETRYILTGVYLTSLGNRIHVVATDGHRLSLFEIQASVPEFGIIVPRRVFSEIKKLLPSSSEVSISSSENQVFFKFEDTFLSSSVIEGEYPNYLAVIPESNPLKCAVDRDEFLTSLREVSVIFDKEDVRPVVLKLSPKSMVLHTKAETGEEAVVEIPADYSGESFEIGFNVVHLSEAVASFEKGDIELFLDTPTTQVLLVSPQDPNLKCVIMPMRI